MKIWLELFINLIESTIIVDFLTRYFGLKKKDWKSYIVVISTEVVLFSVITFFTWNQSFETLSTFIIGVLSFAFCAFFLNGHILEKAFISAFVMALIAVIATVTTLVFGSVFKCDVTKILEFYSPARAIALVTTKVIFFWITRAILKIKLRTELHIQDGLLLVIVPLCSIGAISLLMPAALSDTEIQEYVLGAVITIAIMDFLIYYLFLRIASVIISDVINFSAIIIVSVILQEFICTAIYLLCFLTTRCFCGGYHATTHTRCRIAMLTSYLLFLIIKTCLGNALLITTIAILAALWGPVILYAPIQHANHKLSPELNRINRRRSFCSYGIWSVAIVIMYNVDSDVSIAILASLMIVSLNMVLAKVSLNVRRCIQCRR